VRADLDSLLIALYVLVDDLLPARSGAGRRPRITDAELITLAVAQILLQCHSERRFLRLARERLSHLFPYIPKQPGYNKRLRVLAPEICRIIEQLARVSPSFCERLRLLDSTPVPCGQSRQTAKRSELAGWAAYGRCASHSRYFWALRLYLLCAPDGMPISFCLAPANEPEREVAEALLERARQSGLLTGGEVIVGDKGFAGQEFEQVVARFDATLLRPDRKNEKPRFGQLGRVRQWMGVDRRHRQGPALARAARRPHPRRRMGARLPARARARGRRLAQLAALGSRSHRRPRPPLHALDH
jgi:Transposase DDE domain